MIYFHGGANKGLISRVLIVSTWCAVKPVTFHRLAAAKKAVFYRSISANHHENSRTGTMDMHSSYGSKARIAAVDCLFSNHRINIRVDV